MLTATRAGWRMVRTLLTAAIAGWLQVTIQLPHLTVFRVIAKATACLLHGQHRAVIAV